MKGYIFYRLGKYDESVDEFNNILDCMRSESSFLKADKIWEGLALSLKKLEKYEEAIKAGDRAIEIKKNSSSTYYNRACCQCLLKEDITCLEDLKRAIDLDLKFRKNAAVDSDFDSIRNSPEFKELVE